MQVNARPITVYAPYIPGWASERPLLSGFAIEVLEQVLGERSSEFERRVLPFGRAIHAFHKNKTACFLGGDPLIHEALGGDSNLISSLPFMNVRVVALTSVDQPKIESFKQLDQLILASLPGHNIRSYPGMSEISFKQTVSKDLDRLIRLLHLGRVNAIIDFMPSLSAELGQVHWSKDFTIFKFGDSLVCHNGEVQAALIEWFDQSLRKFTRSERYFQLIETYLHGEVHPPVYD